MEDIEYIKAEHERRLVLTKHFESIWSSSERTHTVSLRSNDTNLQLCTIGRALALTAFVASPSVCGLRLLTPTGAYPGGVVEETWVSEPSDPATFSLLLSNLNTHDTYALVASVNTSAGHVYFTTPDVPSS